LRPTKTEDDISRCSIYDNASKKPSPLDAFFDPADGCRSTIFKSAIIAAGNGMTPKNGAGERSWRAASCLDLIGTLSSGEDESFTQAVRPRERLVGV
jgi:hypothetical protein